MKSDQIATFATRHEAKTLADRLNSGTYYLAHGEYARPDYTARKVRGKDSYYIHARRYYCTGTIGAGESGPLTADVVAGYLL